MDRERALAASRDEARRLTGQPISEVTPSRRDFAQYVATQKTELAVIAGVSKGDMPRLIEVARACDDAEVAAIAVATGPDRLSMAQMAAIADATTAPIMRDDLIVDPSQLFHSRLHGADAAVFPTADLDAPTLEVLVQTASSLHMASVVEVLTKEDIERALRLPHVILGLSTTRESDRVDMERFRELAQPIPRQRTLVVLSAVASPATARSLRGHCDALLVDVTQLGVDSLAEDLRILLTA